MLGISKNSLKIDMLKITNLCEDNQQLMQAFLVGEFTPLPEISVNRDDVWNSLVQPLDRFTGSVDAINHISVFVTSGCEIFC